MTIWLQNGHDLRFVCWNTSTLCHQTSPRGQDSEVAWHSLSGAQLNCKQEDPKTTRGTVWDGCRKLFMVDAPHAELCELEDQTKNFSFVSGRLNVPSFVERPPREQNFVSATKLFSKSRIKN